MVDNCGGMNEHLETAAEVIEMWLHRRICMIQESTGTGMEVIEMLHRNDL